MGVDERRNPARPGSALERERAEIRRRTQPGAREWFEVLTAINAARVQAREEES